MASSATSTTTSPTIGRPAPLGEYALLMLLATLWGSSFSFLKLTIASIPPLTAIAWRTAIAGFVLLAIMRWQGAPLPVDRKSLVSFLIVSLVNTVAPFMLIAWGLQYVDAGLAVILNSTTPIFAFLITFFLLGPGLARSEQLTRRKLFGVAAGITGIVLIVGGEALGGLGRQLMPQIAIVLSSVSYALSAIYGRTFRDMGPIAPAAGSLLIGAALLTPLAIVVEQPWTSSPTWTSIWSLILLGVVGTALGNVLYFRLLGTLGSLGTTAQSYLRVPIGVLVGMLVLGEEPTATAAVGLVAVVAGVAAMTITGPLPLWLAHGLEWVFAVVAAVRDLAVRAMGQLRARAPGWLADARTFVGSPLAIEYALLLLIGLLWSGSYVWVKIGLETIPPLTLMAGRILTAGVFLLAIMRLQGKSLPRDEATWWMFAWQGALASVLPFCLVAWGQQWVDAGPAAILNSLTPMFAFLITWGITRHEPATTLKFAGMILGLVGVAVVIGPAGFFGSGVASSGFGATPLPQLAIVLSSLCYASAAIFSRKFVGRDAVVTAAGSMVCGSLMLLPVALLIDRPWTLSPSNMGLISVLGLGVMSTGLGFIIYFRLSRTLGPMAVTAQSYLRAPFGVFLGAVFLSEAVTLSTFAGLVLVLAGVAAMTWPAKKVP